MDNRYLFGVVVNGLQLDCDDGHTICNLLEVSGTAGSKQVNSMICKSCLNKAAKYTYI